MIKPRILIISVLVLAASVRANLVTTINVTTTADEDGTNPAACSLREAVKAVNTRRSYGGCSTGSAFDDNVIQLQSGDYILNSELIIDQSMEIRGNDKEKSAHDQESDPVTGHKPRRVRPDYLDPSYAIPADGRTGTYIHAPASQRVFYANGSLTLRDVVLQGNGAVTGNGGIIYANRSVSLSNVILREGVVSDISGALDEGYGGAIYLAGDGTSADLSDVTLENNVASQGGGAIAVLCSKDRSIYAAHTLSVVRSVFKANQSADGAGAVNLCGSTSATLSATTFSANKSAASSGTLEYVQNADVKRGQISLSYITAAEQTGHLLSLNGLANISIANSLLGRFSNIGQSTELCFNPTPAVPMVPADVTLTGSHNLLGDNTCDNLISSTSANNIHYDFTITAFESVLNPLATAQPPYKPNGPFGLTEYYLPVSSSPALDAGEELDKCTDLDQRGAERKSGTACDVGAVERLQVTARDDEAESQINTDRLAVVDVLANDSFGEDDSNGPFAFAANDSNSNKSVSASSSDSDVTCDWRLSTDPDYPNMLLVSRKNGVLTDADNPITCTYQVTDSNPVAASAVSATVATVSVQITNAAPVAKPDTYVRPVGVAEISFNPLENDNDDGDGKYGHSPQKNSDGTVAKDGAGNTLFTSDPDWAETYPIEIVSQPQLGKVVGQTSGICPGTEAAPATCFTLPLRYIANNNLSPFSDSFSYRVYDRDNGRSNNSTITIATDAPDLDHGGGAGSFDLLSGLALSLFGLRRLRKL